MNPPSLPVPVPVISPETEEFWAATAKGKLLLRHCNRCDNIIWYPRYLCPICSSFDTSWSEASGSGIVYSFTVVHRSTADGFREATPYIIAYVELTEGPRVMTNIVDCESDIVKIGMPVQIVFHDTGKGSALYRFKPT